MEIYRNDQREVWEPSLEPQTYRLYQNQLRLCQNLAGRFKAHDVLDVGCAQGTLALLLAEEGLSVTALDIRAPFLEYARSRYERGDVRFVAANVMERPTLGEFDLVFANQIVEHLVYPMAFLEILSSYLRQGGRLVLTTPNQHYIRCGLPSYTELGDPDAYVARQFSAGGGDHFFAYTAEELTGFVEDAGLKVEDRFFFESPWISGHMKLRLIQPYLPEAMIRTADRLSLAVAGRRLGHHLAVIALRP
jgi:2-polyprenyl-6-hydroxyphenyl methylase/3-demethylubiquinone-9 3-methyltransferase